MLIGEVSARSGISPRMLRHYDSIGLVRPTGRTPAGYREYSGDDLRRLFHVEGLRSLGLGLQEVAAALEDLTFDPSALVDQLIVRTRGRLARDQDLLRRLGRVRASDPSAWSDVLSTIGLMRGLDAADASERQRVALSLTGENERQAVLLAEAALSETEPNAAGALLWALARTGDAAVPPLAAALDSGDAGHRRRAVEALTKIGSPRASAALARAHPHPDPFVSGRAALARARLGEAAAVPALVDLIVSGCDDVEAADALGELASRHGHEDAVLTALAGGLATSGPAARSRLVTALAGVPGRSATTMLTRLQDDPDRRVALTVSALVQRRFEEPDSTPGGP